MSGDHELILARAGLGERLRAARTAAGLSLDETAARARLPRRHLAAIEDGDVARLPAAATYGAAFVRAYAGALGLDGQAASRTYRRGSERPLPRIVEVEPARPVVEAPPAPRPRWPWLIAAAVLLLPIGYGIRRSAARDGVGMARVAPTPRPMAAPPAPVAAAAPPPAKSAPAPIPPERDETTSHDPAKSDERNGTPSQDRPARRPRSGDTKDARGAAPAATPKAAPPTVAPEATPHAPEARPDQPAEAPSPSTATSHPAVVAPVAAPPPRAAAPAPAASVAAPPASPVSTPPGA